MDFTEKKRVENPRSSTNVVSIMFFWWLVPFFRKGSKRELSSDDLYSVLKGDEAGSLGSALARTWDNECLMAERKKKRPKFYKAVIKVYWKTYSLLVLSHLFNECIVRVGQTLLLQRLVAELSDASSSSSSDSRRDQYLYGTGLVLSTLVYSLVVHATGFGLQHIGMKMRVACSSLIYRKALRISKMSQNQTTVGQIVNLLSNDVGRLNNNTIYLPYLIAGPLQGCLFMYFLWTVGELKEACLAGAGFIILLMPIQYYIGKFTVTVRRKISKRTDVRGQIMNEIIVAMRVIKMYAWELPFSAMVNKIRRLEVKYLRKTASLRAFYMSLYTSGARAMMCLTVLVSVLQGGQLRADQVFFALSVYNIMQLMMVWLIPNAAAHVGELSVAMNRIETFLILEDRKLPPEIKNVPPILTNENSNKKSTISVADPSIVMTGACASWTGAKPTLDDLNLNVRGDKIVMVIGPVGSGKTSLLHALISELPIVTGKCVINGQTCYASQEPWIFSGNLRQNILFGQPYDDARYHQVIQVSALSEDLKQLPFGENTVVGDRGVALSGGQKARVNLARALYQEGDIYLLDDPLSAVDTRVSRHIFEKCVQKYLKGKLRILVTHQLQYLPQADHVVVLNNGNILAQGTYTELVEKGIDFVNLLASAEEEGAKRKESLVIEKDESTTTVKQDDDKPNIKAETLAGGSVTGKTYWEYFASGKSYFALLILFCGFILSQLLASATDYWLSYWTNKVAEQEECENKLNLTTMTTFESLFADNVLKISDDANDLCPDPVDNDLYMYIYGGVVALFFLVCQGRAVYFFQYCMVISTNIHNNMFTTMIRAPAKFFDDNPSGRIMNRFTKDIGAIDELLPPAFFDTLVILLQTVGVLTIVIISNYFMSVPALLLVIALALIRNYFQKTARQVKRIEAINRSPIFTHVVASIQGLTTIRAARAESILIKQFDGHQDAHSSAWYIFLASIRWFGVWLEMTSIVFLVFVTYSFLLLTDWFGSAQVGLGISSVLSLTGIFQFGMRQSAEVENHMTSVERALEYSKLKPEAPLESKPPKKKPNTDWPVGGEIKFEKVFLAYDEEQDVLKNLTFDIKRNEKIGIVGRTGAGKSSLIAALFRLTEPRGDIFIDGIRINDIGLHELRQKISIIPQEPVLFSGTVRYNLDPFDQFPDDQLWTVIKEVELKDAIPALDFRVEDGGSNFSVGQRQLVCLARAILRQNKILVMDEATANVDPGTDKMIQLKIRSKFAACTVITIAHRLHSVIDCDRILVLDHGHLKEYDHPHVLLQNEHGVLKSMVNETGPASSKMLQRLATETFHGRRGSFDTQNVSFLTPQTNQLDARPMPAAAADEQSTRKEKIPNLSESDHLNESKK